MNALHQNGIVTGKAPGVFAPHDQITRTEYITILVRAFGLKAENAKNVFTDVAEGEWYTEAISAASALGVVQGISETEFGVDLPITRQDMFVMLYRLMQSLGIQFDCIRDADEITDQEMIADYAAEAVEAMYCTGIVNGIGDGRTAPEATAERAEAAKIIYEVLVKSGRL